MNEKRIEAIRYLLVSLDALTFEYQEMLDLSPEFAVGCRQADRDALKALGVTDEEIEAAE